MLKAIQTAIGSWRSVADRGAPAAASRLPRRTQKLRLDFTANPGMSSDMDQDNEIDGAWPNLAQALLLEAGRLLEDAAPLCSLSLPRDRPQRFQSLRAVRISLIGALTLIDAAKAATMSEGRAAELFTNRPS